MTLKQQQDRSITVLKTEFERKASEVHKIFEKTMKNVRVGQKMKTHCLLVKTTSQGVLSIFLTSTI